MSVFPGPFNAIVYAQFNLQGRWKRMLIVAGGYGLLLMGAIWLTSALSENFHWSDLKGWVVGIVGLQCMALMVFGTYRVESAVRGDVFSRMIESHRLMPAPPLGSILGYLFGASLQAFLLAGVNYLVGLFCCFMAGVPRDLWLLANAMLLFYSIAIYAVVAQFAFFARGGFLLFLILGVAIVTTTANEGQQMLPSVNVLLAPIISHQSIFVQMAGGALLSTEVLFAYASGVIGTAIIALVAIRVGIRRYRSSTIIGITAPLGLILLAVWVALAVVQMHHVEYFNYNRFHSYHHDDVVSEVIFTFISALLLAMFPIGSAARAICQAERAAIGSADGSKSLFLQRWVIVLAMLLLGLLLVDIPEEITTTAPPTFPVLLIQFNFLVSIACIFRWGYLLRRRAWVFASLWVIITWVGPVIVDAVYHAATAPIDPNIKQESWSSIVAISPAGALALIWSDTPVSILPGIAGQIILTIIPASLLAITSRWQRHPHTPPSKKSILPV